MHLGGALELVCGTGLESNPPATITWRDPQGDIVTNSTRYTLVNDGTGVRLLFATAISTDIGMWTCEVRVDGISVTTESGDTADLLIGKINTITLSHGGEHQKSYGRRLQLL